jgi:hypothetical protein
LHCTPYLHHDRSGQLGLYDTQYFFAQFIAFTIESFHQICLTASAMWTRNTIKVIGICVNNRCVMSIVLLGMLQAEDVEREQGVISLGWSALQGSFWYVRSLLRLVLSQTNL